MKYLLIYTNKQISSCGSHQKSDAQKTHGSYVQ